MIYAPRGQETEHDIPEIAIVGMGCRFPGANGVDAFWQLLQDNIDAVTPVPADRFDVAEHYAVSTGTPGVLPPGPGARVRDQRAAACRRAALAQGRRGGGAHEAEPG
ncbi:beta-ketoacyl synthase N-terminal-like domain-containing protein [Streptomyces sp. NPDC050145]|uniref:beta-ketoacyl synthase N-terminal-like domain-containing protein n=1 Tax=Streptomyces sp. NPDC050145 TaxID=3365602 RepID=UPI0037894A9C